MNDNIPIFSPSKALNLSQLKRHTTDPCPSEHTRNCFFFCLPTKELIPPSLYGTTDGCGIRHRRQRRSVGGGRLHRQPWCRSFEDVDDDVEALDDVSEEILHQRHHVPVRQQLPLRSLVLSGSGSGGGGGCGRGSGRGGGGRGVSCGGGGRGRDVVVGCLGRDGIVFGGCVECAGDKMTAEQKSVLVDVQVQREDRVRHQRQEVLRWKGDE